MLEGLDGSLRVDERLSVVAGLAVEGALVQFIEGVEHLVLHGEDLTADLQLGRVCGRSSLINLRSLFHNY